MHNKRSLLVLPLLSLGLLGLSVAKADDDPHCFTLESFKGTYTVIGHYEGDIAIALGVRHLDDEGNLTGTFVLNEPEKGSTTGARTILTGTQKGSITTLHCNGTGVFTRTATASNGIVTTTHDDFVVTRAIEKDGKLRVTAIQDAQVTPSSLVSPPVLLTRVWTRVPDPKGEEEWEQ
jgi:hypothetical protein